MPPKFIYFDLGNVLLHFSHERMCRQMGAVANLPPEKIRSALFGTNLKDRFETGAFREAEYYEALCAELGTRPDRAALEKAGNDIFSINSSLIPLVVALEGAGNRLGILSNICENHWNWVGRGRYGLINEGFEVFALSYEIGAVKPDPKIFQAAAQLAGVAPQEIFFTDDIPGHVAAAKQCGFDAVQFTTTAALAQELRNRGIRTNY